MTERVNEYTYMVKNNRTEKVTKIHIGDLKADQVDGHFLEKEIKRYQGSRDEEENC